MPGNQWEREYRDGEALLFPIEVAKILAVTPRQVHRMAKKGRLRVAADTPIGFRYSITDVIDMACKEAE